MPWVPEHFSWPALAQLQEKHERLDHVPYYDGLLAGEPEALIESFAGEPQVHDPVRGRVRGTRAFLAFVSERTAWLAERNVAVGDGTHVVTDRRGFEEVALQLDGERGRVEVPVAIVADRARDGRIEELRVYHSGWPLTGRHLNRPPVLQADAELRVPDVVADYQRALAAGDAEAVVATFEPDGSAREPAGGAYTHGGTDGLRAFYAQLFSNDGGIPLEHCAITDDGRACALEYNVVRWGTTELPPQAGVAVYVRGSSGGLTAARIYDDVDPPVY
jgi:hypothetical protein